MQVSEAAITGITKLFFDRVKSFLDRRGKQMHGGIIVDATIIDALSLTRMRKKSETWRLYGKFCNQPRKYYCIYRFILCEILFYDLTIEFWRDTIKNVWNNPKM